jgi:hypothetical protein
LRLSRPATRTHLAQILFIALAFSPTLLLQRSLIVQSDEGYTLNAAWQLWTGMRMYDDFRLFVAPGSSYLVYLVWSVVGNPSHLAARLLSLVLSFSSIAAVTIGLRQVSSRGVNLGLSVAAWAFASSLYVLLNHNSFSSFAATWWLLCLLRIAGDESAARSKRLHLTDDALAGVAAGVVGLFLQTKGLALVGATLGFAALVSGPGRRLLSLVAVAAGFAAVIAPLAIIWRPSVLIREWFTVPLAENYLGHTGSSRGLALAAFAVVCAMAWISWRRRDRRMQALAVAQAALVASVLHNAEPGHMAINAFPFIMFVSRIVATRREGSSPAGIVAQYLTMAAVVALLAVIAVVTPGGRQLAASSVLVADLIDRRPHTLIDGERLAAAHAIYAGPFLPGLYYQLGKPNPFFVSETIVCDPACQQRLVGQLSQIKPEVALLHYDMVRHLAYDQNNPVDIYLRDHYVLCPGPYIGDLIVRARDATWCP